MLSHIDITREWKPNNSKRQTNRSRYPRSCKRSYERIRDIYREYVKRSRMIFILLLFILLQYVFQ